jgi:DNA-binding Lrp family transcriptional regulator
MTTPTADTSTRTEEQHVTGENLLARVKELIHEGNIRRITIKNDEGRAILEIPLTVGVVGAMLLPIWVAVGAIAALAADYRLEVEKRADE